MKENEFIPLISEKEEEQVIDLIKQYSINVSNLHINICNDRFIGGIFGNNINGEIKDYFKYNHFIESINDIADKTKLSINMCLEYYKKVNYLKYNPISNIINEEEYFAYYYMENALFREIVLWEALAQVYNIYFKLNLDITKVNYKYVIKKLENNSKIDFENLNKYIEEPKNLESLDTGVHKYVDDLRNQMTHRYSIAITSLSENYNLRAMPDTLYRIAKDYNMVMSKLCEIINIIVEDTNSSNIKEKISNFDYN